MSIQNVAGADAAGWSGSLADASRAPASAQSGSGGSSLVSELSAEFAALAEMFSSMLSGVESETGTGTSPASTGSTPAGTSAAEQLLGTRSLAVEQSSPSVSPAQASTNVAESGSPAVERAPVSSSVNALSAADAAAAGSSATQSAGTTSAQSPSTGGSGSDGGDTSLSCCTLAQAQSVAAAFPGATLEVWNAGSLPVPVGTGSSASPDEALPYVINFGTNATTGQPDYYYASVIYNAGQQALQQTAQGPMKAGDYYVWNTTPDANGVMETTDVGSTFNQFAQYYMSQMNANKAVDLYTYSTDV